MTLALIALIVLVFYWIYHDGKLRQDIADHKRKTITNVELEKQIYKEVEEELLEKFSKEYPPLGETWKLINQQYDIYGVPYNTYGTKAEWEKERSIDYQRCRFTEHYVEAFFRDTYYWNGDGYRKFPYFPPNDRELSELNEQKVQELKASGVHIYYKLPEHHYGLAYYSAINEILFEYEPSPEISVPNISAAERILWTIRGLRKYETHKNGSMVLFHDVYIYEWFGHTCLYQCYRRLVKEIVRKRLWEKGFNLSGDGTHESDWQEWEKKYQGIKERKDKYPWT